MRVLNDIISDLQPELSRVDSIITTSLQSDVALINEVSSRIINAGGKRLRPLLVILCAKGCNNHGSDYLHAATIVEFIHTATLLHDDVVDESHLRRGIPTANSLWGNQAAILVGDFLYSRAFQLMVALNIPKVMAIMADATNAISEGEMLQLTQIKNIALTEKQYLQTITLKTAKLFEAAAKLAGVVSHASDVTITALGEFGLNFGIAYQMIDDLLDYANVHSGKNPGEDLSNGKLTLPIIYLLQQCKQAERQLVVEAIHDAEASSLNEIRELLDKSSAKQYILDLAKKHIDKAKLALNYLPRTNYRDIGYELLSFVLARVKLTS